MTNNFASCSARIAEFIRRSSSGEEPIPFEIEFQQLALELFSLQLEHNPAYRRLCELRGLPSTIHHWSQIPAVPTAAFKELDLTSLPPGERTTVFHSSGTTEQKPSRHFHNAASLALYEASLRPWFRAHLLADDVALSFLSLTPPPALAPHSSLVHMFATVSRVLGGEGSDFTGMLDNDGAWALDFARIESVLNNATRPLLLLGTAFNFVHLLDHLAAGSRSLRLPAGSRVLETGGYKGRSRVVPQAELHALITARLGVPAERIVCEYGMSELSSQAYDRAVPCSAAAVTAPRCFRFPPWCRVQIVSPETGRPVAEGESGLLRIFDLANVRSVLALQTEDLALRRGEGFELIGRATTAVARGCSLMPA